VQRRQGRPSGAWLHSQVRRDVRRQHDSSYTEAGEERTVKFGSKKAHVWNLAASDLLPCF
jgi:hypothetical protein